MRYFSLASIQSLTTKQKIGYVLLVAFILFYVIKECLGHGDFTLFLKASELIRLGDNPYGKWIQIQGENYSRYFYSPLWSILLWPFTYLPFVVGRLFWLCMNVWFTFRIWILLKKYVDLKSLTQNQANWVIILSTALSIRFILYNFDLIQMTLFLLWGILESVQRFRSSQWILGGVILALIINVKIMPIVILPYLAFRGQFKALSITIAAFILMLFLPALFLGWETNLFLLGEWWSVIDPTMAEHKFESEIGPHSLIALIPALLMETQGRLGIARNILNLTPELVTMIVRSAQSILVIFTLYFLKWPAFRVSKDRLDVLYELAYISLVIPLIFPHQQKYAFALAIPAQFYLAYYLISQSHNRKTRWKLVATFLALSFVLMTLTTDGVIGRELNLISRHFKLVTYGMFFLIAALAFARPKHLRNRSLEPNDTYSHEPQQ